MLLSVRVDDPNAALEAIVEVALASASCEDLSLDDHVIASCRCQYMLMSSPMPSMAYRSD